MRGAMTLPLQGVGLGLRRIHLDPLAEAVPEPIRFLEIAPENWMRVGGRLGRLFRQLTESTPFSAHGLSLSLGSADPLDMAFLKELKTFLEDHRILAYSEHLSYCSDQGHLYDLMPIPFTEEAAAHVARRIIQTQEILERRIAIENVSYYLAPGQEMAEIDFLLAVLELADCDLLLDVNNVYVNSVNHRYSADAFLAKLPGARITGLHIAGHYVEAEDLLIDTHGASPVAPVWSLLASAYDRFGGLPTLLERDFNIPPLQDLKPELDRIDQLQRGVWSKGAVAHG
ncbi:MAG: DUF692 domain-containing protein [Gammaproteobacteria bacterium]|nr:DUF692 domain-containing protein [Gammaproteobacteria bacterium]NBT44735.1 DUF692 domain-containing protein [Gammaproteobacteria bacterium]NBY23852.1 DUF692 domain-containing protein [Gammaproteobacteria bacterium]NDE34691.1 DUF692 domain-containing protein [Gammaproteobacteria bacterium]NDE56713.1 DUF692 domain-containing protein [Gammaproteobacteria bacterium]